MRNAIGICDVQENITFNGPVLFSTYLYSTERPAKISYKYRASILLIVLYAGSTVLKGHFNLYYMCCCGRRKTKKRPAPKIDVACEILYDDVYNVIYKYMFS